MFFLELHVGNAFLFLENFLEIFRLLKFGLCNATAKSVIFVLNFHLTDDSEMVAGSENGERFLLLEWQDTFFAVLDFREFFFESTKFLLMIVLDQMAFLSFFKVQFHISFL